MATQITADLPTLNFPREVDYPTQEDWAAFSAAAEKNFGILGGDWSTQMQLWKTEANAMSTELNTNAVNTENNAILANGLANFKGAWSGDTTYAKGQSVESTTGSKIYYTSKLDGNLNHSVTDTTYWLLNPINNKADKATTLAGYGITDAINKDINSLTAKTTPIDTDNTIISEADGTLKKLSWENLKATLLTYFSTAFKSLSYKPTLVSITAWNYSSTTITLTVASHTFVAGDTIEVQGLTTTDTGTGATSTYVPNGVWTVTSVTGTTIVYTASVAPTVTNKSVSSATVKGIVLVNGIYGGLGVGQTYKEMVTKRLSGNTYTNTTGKTIAIAVSFFSVGGTSFTSITMYVDGAIIIQETSPTGGASQISASGFIIVPNNSTYRVDVSGFAAGTLSYKELS